MNIFVSHLYWYTGFDLKCNLKKKPKVNSIYFTEQETLFHIKLIRTENSQYLCLTKQLIIRKQECLEALCRTTLSLYLVSFYLNGYN